MGDCGRDKKPATRPKQPRGRGRTAAKSNDEPAKGRTAAKSTTKSNDEPAKKTTVAKSTDESPKGRTAAKSTDEPVVRRRAAAKRTDEPAKGRTATKSNAKSDDEPVARRRRAAKSNEEPAKGRTEAAGRAQTQSSPNKEPARRAAQKSEPEEGKAARVKVVKEKSDHLDGVHNDRRLQHHTLRPLLERLKLKMKDISNAANKVNAIVKTIIQGVSGRDPLFRDMERMSTGSYYEGVKISRPNEFDIMLKIPISDYQRIGLTEFGRSGAFYTLSCKRNIVDFMNNYVDDEGNISAQEILKQFRKLVESVVLETGMAVSVKRRIPSSPALTLKIENKPTNIDVDLVIALEIRQSWPENTKDGMNIDSWLGKKVKRDFKFFPFYMVPKQSSQGKTMKDTWRISFSHIEKEILTNHGSSKTCCELEGEKCCRKQCLKVMKYLLELLKKNGKPRKQLNKFCSYYAKTALLHQCAYYPRDEEWKLEDLDICFNRYIRFFQSCLKDACLKNFFIPSHNLFSMDSVDCKLFYDLIDDQIKQNYPLFDK